MSAAEGFSINEESMVIRTSHLHNIVQPSFHTRKMPDIFLADQDLKKPISPCNWTNISMELGPYEVQQGVLQGAQLASLLILLNASFTDPILGSIRQMIGILRRAQTMWQYN